MSAVPPLRRPGPSSLLQRRPPSGPTMLAARRQFLTRGEAPEDLVPAPILRSWRRCAALGLHMDMRPTIEPLGRGEFGERRERADRLRLAARSEIELLHEEARAAGGIVVLTDADGLVLETLGAIDFAEKAARVSLKPGVAWVEAATGTNAIGTALAERRDVSVVGGEHWFETHRILTCTAAPILGPTGTPIGALDLSNHAEVQHTHAPALVRRAVAAIEHRLFAETFAARGSGLDVVRFHRDPAELGGPREGLLAFEDDRLIGATPEALALLGLDWDALGATRWGEVFADRRDAVGEVVQLTTATGRSLFGRLDRPTPVPPRSPDARPSRPPIAPALRTPSRSDERPTGEPGIVWDDIRSRALARAGRLLDAEVPVLLQGETGTGKEVFARALHAAGRRRDRPFVAVNCAALPEGLIEAELFGYEEGAFTGARKRGSKGLMREADGGVLFLDEIGDMPLALQARLLRALQSREVTPLGGGRPVPVDFALICASHRDLAEAVATKDFREDLYFRIAQYTVELEPLRGRADLAEVISGLWSDLSAGTGGASLASAALDRLVAHPWPGNFRQLVATLRVLAILAEPGECLTVEALPADIRRTDRRPPPATAEAEPPARHDAADAPEPRGDLDALTASAIRAALDSCGGNVTRAAARLGIHRSTLHRRVAGTREGRKH